MRRPVILSSSICFIVFVLLAPGVVADQAPMWESPIGLTPGLPSTHVQMAAEVVRVEVQQNGTDVHAHVDATFDMVNRGPDERMYVVFPTYASSGIPEDVRLPYSQVYFQPQALSDFRAWTNSETYTPTLRRIRTGSFSADDWYVWNMLYPGGKALQVRVSYTQRLDDITYSGNTRWVPVSYVLRTGALWDGPIGEARISMSAPDGGGFARRIGQSSELAGELVWTMTNFKPTEDIEAEYLTSRVWNRLRDADAAANVQNPTAHDLIDATRSVLETFGSESLYRKPNVFIDHYFPLARSWTSLAVDLNPESPEAWELAGDLALLPAPTKYGWVKCWPEAAVTAYQTAANLGSASASSKLDDLANLRQEQLVQMPSVPLEPCSD